MTVRTLAVLGLACVVGASDLRAQKRRVERKSTQPFRTDVNPKPPEPKLGVIEGDVFLVMKSGDVTEIAGSRVLLLGGEGLRAVGMACTARSKAAEAVQTDSIRLEAAAKVSALSPTEQNVARESALQSEAFYRRQFFNEKQRELVSALASALVKDSPTGMNAHYRLADVPAGTYILHAASPIGTNLYEWWVQVTQMEGETKQVDLDNAALKVSRVRCPLPKRYDR